MSVLEAKQNQFQAKTAEAVALRDKIAITPNEDDQKAFDAIMDVDIPALEGEIKRLRSLEAIEGEVASEKEPERKANYAPASVEHRGMAAFKTIGEQFVESEDYKRAMASGGLKQGNVISVEAKGYRTPFEQKATFTSSGTGANTTVNYLPGVVDVRQQPLSIRDLVSVGETSQAAVTYIQETSFTNAATAVAEEGLKPEATFATSVVVAPVKKIAVIGRVTDEMFSDFPMMRDYVNERLRFMVAQREEAQLYGGTGVGANLTGITATAGIQTQAVGTISATNTVADNIFRAITKIRTTGFMEPDGIVIHPTDYQIIRLTKDSAFQYFGGGPFMSPYGNSGGVDINPPLWGLRTVVSTAATAGTALVGAFRMGAQIWQREGIRVDTSNSDASDFQYNRVAIRVEERLALAVYRPLAFCTVTGIA